MSWKAILLAGLMAISAGCANHQTMPTRPTLEVIRTSDGGVYLSRDDTARLGFYIIELERAVETCQ